MTAGRPDNVEELLIGARMGIYGPDITSRLRWVRGAGNAVLILDGSTVAGVIPAKDVERLREWLGRRVDERQNDEQPEPLRPPLPDPLYPPHTTA